MLARRGMALVLTTAALHLSVQAAGDERTWSRAPPSPPPGQQQPPPPVSPEKQQEMLATVAELCPSEHAECTGTPACLAEMTDSFGPRTWRKPPSPLLEKVIRCYREQKAAPKGSGGGKKRKPKRGTAMNEEDSAAATDATTGASPPVGEKALSRIANDIKCEVCSYTTEDMLSMIVQQVATDREKASDGANGAKKWLDGLCDEPRPMVQRMIGLYDIKECKAVDIDLARLDPTRPCSKPNQLWHAIREPPQVASKRHFLRHLYINGVNQLIILPRQARDKHRENSKTMAFRTGRVETWRRGRRRRGAV
jgi:hypothetical protein